MNSRIIASLLLSFVFYIGSSQVSYHRLYETSIDDPSGLTDTIFHHMCSTTNSGDVYAMGTKRVGEEDLSIIFTKHSNKGDIDWSKELDLGQDTVEIQSIGNFKFNGALDSILFVIDVEINGERTEIFGRLDANGNEIDLKKVGGVVLSPVNFTPDVSPFVNQSDLLLTTSAEFTLSRLSQDEDVIWSRRYEFVNSDNDPAFSFVTDFTSTPDSTIVLTGSGDGVGGNFVAAELDSNGVQIWAESYDLTLTEDETIFPTEIKPLSDGSFVVVGSYFAGALQPNNGFVAHIDSSGSVLMAKKVNVTDTTEIYNVIEAADGTLWLSGLYSSSDSSLFFTTNMNLDGTINWTSIYPEELANSSPYTTSLLNVQDTGGATLVGHGFIDDLPVMQVMKHDELGVAMCSDTIPIVLEDLVVVADTLTSTAVDGGIFLDSLDFELDVFGGFSPPTLSIEQQYPPFCPNEVIDTILVAVVNGVEPENITYEWGEGQLTDSIRITDIGMYMVTVTITEDVCYKMCDTIQLTRLSEPDVTISLDNSRFCEEKIIMLNSNYMPGATGETYLWSTMETTSSIEVTEFMTYSVTVTDECGEMAQDDIEVTFPFTPQANFGPVFSNFCDTDTATVIAAYIGGGDEPIYTWSDGQTGDTIKITLPGTYTLTVTDECGNSATLEADIEFPECEGPFDFPIAFFPGGEDEDSKKFGPIPTDSMDVDQISDVEFKVFNRWGETVFESNDFFDAWDGSHKGDPAPSEVYIWYMSFIERGVQKLEKGDVTLIR